MNLKFFKTFTPLARSAFSGWLLVILWMFVIFYLSHQPELKSGLEDWLDFVLRKIAHITEYAILCFLLIRASKNKKWAFLIAFLYACSDEFHQLFVFGRHGSPRDIGIDTIGIILAVYFYKNIYAKFQKIFQKF